ncbi:protein meaA [Methylocystis sp. FS]|uniref:protein meaA n=1 Tax=Methylocystis silviterrae TaxID=2743612 RepID=UPI0015817303|nr:protein meaA [Methylocystis silviterrae]NUJ80015.1 protein meaA [Methylocystis silviterrae]
MNDMSAPRRDKPWMFRTYAGHSTASESNKLYRSNLAKGQTGLSIAFDLPTQTGYDCDHILSRGEVGKVGVPVSHLGDMRALFDGIPIGEMNTSMTINATAVWLMALYIAAAEEQGAPRAKLQGTTQNDIIKEYLSRGSYVFPPTQSLRLTQDLILFTTKECPKFNPMNVCSYHLQEAGATPSQELAYALATAVAILDGVKAAGMPEEDFAQVVGRISFFVNAGMRFVTELCKMRAFAELWEEITRERYGVKDEKLRRFRYGVQVNSLGLTEQQPENNVYRILIEMLAVVLSKNARARAVQLPAWNEALGLPRPFDQQWSLRMQQIMAYETDLLEYGDIFDGNPEIARKVAELKAEAMAELKKIEDLGGAAAAVEIGYMKGKLVEANTARLESIEAGEQIVVGVNKFTGGEPSPLASGDDQIMVVPEHVEAEQISRLKAWREARDQKAAQAAIEELARAAKEGRNMVEPSIAAARAGVTTGEWGNVLRGVFGEYRAPTGVSSTARQVGGALDAVRGEVERVSQKLGKRAKFLVGKPGLDGHSNGAEQIAVRARDAGFDVIYAGIRSTPAELVEAAKREGAHCIGLSILSGSHVTLAHEVIKLMKQEGVDAPLVVGGIIPPADEKLLREAGVAAVYTPKNYDLNAIMTDLAHIIEKAAV